MHSRSQKQAVNTGKFPECSAAPCSSESPPAGLIKQNRQFRLIHAYPNICPTTAFWKIHAILIRTMTGACAEG